MQGQDVQFFEEFKRLEKLCGEIYGQKSGVSAYIADMESRARQGQTAVPAWTADYKALKHARWLRNQLAHDAVERQLSKKEDLAFLRDFRRRLGSGQDPLSLLGTGGKKRRFLPALLILVILALLALALLTEQGRTLLASLRALLSGAGK